MEPPESRRWLDSIGHRRPRDIGHVGDDSLEPSRQPSGDRADTEATVAKFMDVHSGFVGVTAQQLKEAHERDLAIEADEGVHFERAWLDPERGKVFCLATGPSREAVMRIHDRAGHPTIEVYELTVEVA
jgi:hypothetical protein